MASVPTAQCPSDEELACRAQQGCSASFEELVRRYQVPLLQFLSQRADAHEAEDLVQDTMVRVYQNLHRYRTTWRFTTWVFTIAHRLSINRRRQRRPRADSTVLDAMAASTPPPGQLVADEENRRQLWDVAVAVLSPEQVTALWLYYVEDMPVKEVARVVGRSRVAVKTMLFRARKALLPSLQSLDEINNDCPKSFNTSPCASAAEVTHD